MKTQRIPVCFFGSTRGARPVLLCLIAAALAACMPATPTPAPFPCVDPIGCVTIRSGEPVRIGVLQSLTGGASPGGLEQYRSIQLAVKDRGSALMGHPIELAAEDERCSAEGGANAALRLVADPQVVGILGTNCSSAAVTAGKIMSEKGLVMISSSNTYPALTSHNGAAGAEWHPGYFRTVWNDAVMGQAAARFAYEHLGVQRAAVIHAGDAYTKGLTAQFREAFTGLGGEVVIETTIDEDDPNLNPTLDAVRISRAELVFFPLSQPEAGANLIRQARAAGDLSGLAFLGGETMLSNIFLREAGEPSGVYILGPAALDSQADADLRRRFTEANGEAPAAFYYSFAYDAANLLLNAIEQTAQSGPDGGLSVGRQALRDALYTTRDFPGLTGRLTCDRFGDCGAATLAIVQVQAGSPDVEALRRNIIFRYPEGE